MDQEEVDSYREEEVFSHVVMEESGMQGSSGLETSLSRGEVVEVTNGALERDSMEEEIGELRLRGAIDRDLRSQEISERHEMAGNFRLEMRGGMYEKAHSQRLPMHSPSEEEVDSVDEEGVIGISADAGEALFPKSGTRLHPGAGPVIEIGRGKCGMTEIVNVIWRPAGGKTSFEESGRSAKEMIGSGESLLSVQTPGIRPVDSKRLSPLVQIQ